MSHPVFLPGDTSFVLFGAPHECLLRWISFGFLLVDEYSLDGAVSFVSWWVHSLSFPVDSSLSCWIISVLALRLASSCIYFFEMASVRSVPY